MRSIRSGCVLVVALASLLVPAAAAARYAPAYDDVHVLQSSSRLRLPGIAVGSVVGRDRRADIVVSVLNPFTERTWLVVFPGRAHDSFGEPTRISFPGHHSGIGRVTTGDLNGDGRQDVAVGTDPGIVRFQQRHGRLVRLPPIGPRGAFEVVIHDVTGDGRPDLVAVTLERLVLMKRTSSGYAARTIARDRWTDVAVGDVTGDDRADLVACCDPNDGSPLLTVFRQTPAHRFRRFTRRLVLPGRTGRGGYAGIGVALGDVTGDGRRDAVVTVSAGYDSVLDVFAQTTGTLAAARAQSLLEQDPGPVVIADANGDRLLDIVVGHGDSGNTVEPPHSNLGVLIQRADGGLAKELLFRLPQNSHILPGQLAVGYLNGDRRVDVAAAQDLHRVIAVLHR